MNRDAIIKILTDKAQLKNDQIAMVVNEKEKTGAPFGYLLIKFGLITADRWYNFVLKELKIVPLNISGMEIEKDILSSLPEFTCRKYRAIPVYKGGKKLICSMVDPSDEDVIEELKKISHLDIEPRLIKDMDVKIAIDKYLAQGSLKIISPAEKINLAGNFFKPTAVKEISEASAVEAVEKIITKAMTLKATDIHIEIEEGRGKLRYRINGLLYEFPPPPLELYPTIVSHIKVLSSLDIAEKRIPQDGYLKMKLSGTEVDLRISTFPTIFGEMVAIRMLDKKNIVSGLERLGFIPQTLHSWRTLLEETFGLLLVTGPTGSGKTTTLYSSISELDCLHKKIITIEDPVEYHIHNVDQTQINPKTRLTFATALRSILRQDPDVVMIGEIRDRETAEISLRAAQTGQLVFSTLHTNTAPAAPVRLIDMGIEPYLISSSLIGVLNQRLVRSICPNCKERYKPLKEELCQIGISPDIEFLFRGKGCHICNGTGFDGRTGIFELMVMNEKLKREVMINPEVSRINEIAKTSGMKTLREDGIIKILDGITTISEVLYSTKK